MGSADKINILVVDDLPAKLLLIEAGLRGVKAERHHGPLRRGGAGTSCRT